MKTAADILRASQNIMLPCPVLAPYLRPDGLTLLSGPEGCGKSSLLSSIAKAVAGGICPGWADGVRSGRVLWLTGEETELGVAESLLSAANSNEEGDSADEEPSSHGRGGDETRAAEILSKVVIESITEPNIPGLIETIRRINPALVIADPVDVLAPPGRSPRGTLEPLLREASRRGIALVGVLHTLHGARVGAKLIKGAGDWTRLARSILYYGPDPRLVADDHVSRSILYTTRRTGAESVARPRPLATTASGRGRYPTSTSRSCLLVLSSEVRRPARSNAPSTSSTSSWLSAPFLGRGPWRRPRTRESPGQLSTGLLTPSGSARPSVRAPTGSSCPEPTGPSLAGSPTPRLSFTRRRLRRGTRRPESPWPTKSCDG